MISITIARSRPRSRCAAHELDAGLGRRFDFELAPAVRGVDKLRAGRGPAQVRRQQIGRDGVVELEPAPQQRRRALAGILAKLNETPPDERPAWLKQAAAIQGLARAAAHHLQRQSDARAFARHVVVQVGVERLVDRVELGSERDQQNVDLGGREIEIAGQRGEREEAALRFARAPPLLDARPQGFELAIEGRQRRHHRGLAQPTVVDEIHALDERVDLRFPDHEPAHVGRRVETGMVALQAQCAHQHEVEPLQFLERVLGAVGVGGCAGCRGRVAPQRG